MKRILCLDGGGILGYLSARILQKLERDLFPEAAADAGNQWVKHFDLITGTSTGSILAAGISLGLPLQQIVDLYAKRGSEIFPNDLAQRLRRAARLIAPLYSDRGLQQVLSEAMRIVDENGERDATLADLKKPTVIPTFDATRHQPVIFKSHKPEHESDLKIPLWKIVKSSCSAPTYFPAQVLDYQRQLRHRDGSLAPPEQRHSAMIDGGVIANNPTLCGLAEVLRGTLGGGSRDALVVSIGTSQPDADGLSPARARRLGLAEWALPLIDIFMGGAGLHVHGLAYRIVERDQNNLYVRFEIVTRQALEIDRASPRDFARLDGVVEDYLSGHRSDPARAQLHRDYWYDYAGNLERLQSLFQQARSPMPSRARA